jgi:hypothetical protein
MAKPPKGPADPRYSGPDYDPEYGPPFDAELGQPVSPPLLPRTPPRHNRRLAAVAGAVVAGVLVVAAVAGLALRSLGPDEVVTRPPATPSVLPGSGGQAKAVVDALTAQGYRCTAQFAVRIAARHGCFATRSDTVLAGAVFESDDADTIDAVRLTVRELSWNPALYPRDRATMAELAEVVAGTAFPEDQAQVAAALSRPGPRKILKGAWGNYRVSGNKGDTLVLYADRSGRSARQAPVPAIGTPRKVLVGELSNSGWLCAATCTKRERAAVSSLVLAGTGDTVAGLRLIVTTPSVGPVEPTRTAFHQQLSTLLGMLDGDGLDRVGGWLAEQRNRGSGSSYVGGWRVTAEATYADDRPAGYQFRLDAERTLAPLNS